MGILVVFCFKWSIPFFYWSHFDDGTNNIFIVIKKGKQSYGKVFGPSLLYSQLQYSPINIIANDLILN